MIDRGKIKRSRHTIVRSDDHTRQTRSPFRIVRTMSGKNLIYKCCGFLCGNDEDYASRCCQYT